MKITIFDILYLTALSVLLAVLVYWATGCAALAKYSPEWGVRTIDAGPRVLPTQLDGFRYYPSYGDIWTQC